MVDAVGSPSCRLSSNNDRLHMDGFLPTDDPIACVAKALGHPARLRILRLLLETPGCIGGDIVDAVGLAQSTVSEHLRILKAAGAVRGEIDGPRVCYALSPDAFHELAMFASLLSQSAQDVGCCMPSNPKKA